MATATLNAWLAAAVALLAIGTINRMNGTTNWSVRFAVLLILAAMLGQSLGFAAGQWDHYCDTLLYAGVAGFLLSCRRNPIGIPYPWNELSSYGVMLGSVLYVPFGPIVATVALTVICCVERDAIAGFLDDARQRVYDLVDRAGRDPWPYALRVVWFVVASLIVGLAAVSLVGCAQPQARDLVPPDSVPECATVDAFYAMSPEGPVIAFTLANYAAMEKEVEKRTRGECR